MSGPGPASDASTLDFGFFSYDSRQDLFDRSAEYWNPAKTEFWDESGIDLVLDRRDGYFIWDLDGRRFIDLHLNGGVFNLGHRNPEVIETLEAAMERFDLGNHHFPSVARTALAEALVESAPPGISKAVFASGGGEAIDIALKSARWATKRRKIVSVVGAYHGHTGLAVAAGNERFSEPFLADRPDEFVTVPFNDADAMRQTLAGGDIAAVIIETIPATYGFRMPAPGYLAAVKAACEEFGSLYIADEVQTGLMRTGELWAVTKHGVDPDIIVTGKGICGGIYPIAATLLNERAAGWLDVDGFSHVSTMGGAELGAIVGLKVLEITQRPEVRSMVDHIARRLGDGVRELAKIHDDFFVEIRQDGLVMGLGFDHPEGGHHVMRGCFENGIWAIFAALDNPVMQFKPGLLLSPELCDEILERLDAGITAGKAAARADRGGRS